MTANRILLWFKLLKDSYNAYMELETCLKDIDELFKKPKKLKLKGQIKENKKWEWHYV